MPFIRTALIPLALIAAAPSAAVERVDVAMANFSFTPATIHFRHGQPYLLHLSSSGGHAFAAKAFFAAATIPAADRAKIKGGKIELDGGASVDIHLTAPAPGTYPVSCTHFLHTSFGMTGKIIVD
ncbi:MAG: plastocyanin/azurin family copper-binding protein [Pseudomonadota bacterium]